ncbi:MAG: histidine phosphatase family protein [Saprospiraceae bacterium]|nr:histidine phosphatase family protein [Saprospiraceae bacterium]
MSNKKVFIVRHGETDFNRQGIVQGQGVDTSLNALGKEQALAFYRHYSHLNFEAVLTSKLQRTHQTMAHFINKGIQWEQFAEINEISWGIHEGKKGEPSMRESYRELMAHWNSGNLDARIPEGESAAELGARVEQFVQHLRQREESLLLVCAHGRTMRALICLLKDVPLTEMNRFHHSNTGLWQVQQENIQFNFLAENDTSHLTAFQVEGL